MTVGSGTKLRVTAVLTTPAGVTIENVFYSTITTYVGGDDVAVTLDMAQWLDDAYDNIKSMIPLTTSFMEVRCHNVTTNTPMPTASWPVLTAGTGTGDIAPEGVAALVLLRTAALKVLGRKFVGPLTEGAITDGLMTAGALVDLLAFATAIIVPFASVPTSNVYKFGVQDKLGVLRDVVSVAAVAIPAYQRRRRRFRGI
jgi:hypothetical protein